MIFDDAVPTTGSALSSPGGEPLGRVETGSQDEWRAALRLSGEFDAANADELHSVLESHLAAGRRVLRIDLTDVTFMDSTAIGILVQIHDHCTRDHGSVILTGVSARLGRLLQITGLDHVLLIDSAGDAPAEPIRD